ncbi:MAG TPA: S1 family peptidase [Xanthobacteraceae bacterium]|nr:S1 family peptidase [Xanthobacteraceae bacterium]
MICRALLPLACSLALCAPAYAIVGGAREAGALGDHMVMIVGARGDRVTLCTGIVLARDVVLTAAHCVAPAGAYRVLPGRGANPVAIARIAHHPRYDPRHYASGRVTADVALLKLANVLPARNKPALLDDGAAAVAAGERLLIAGYGVAVAGRDESAGAARAAALLVTGRPGNLQIRLVDPATRGERAGLGACIGDSGGPAFREGGAPLRVIGVVSWSTGPGEAAGCGGMTGVTPLVLYRPWIVEQAAKMGATLR